KHDSAAVRPAVFHGAAHGLEERSRGTFAQIDRCESGDAAHRYARTGRGSAWARVRAAGTVAPSLARQAIDARRITIATMGILCRMIRPTFETALAYITVAGTTKAANIRSNVRSSFHRR